MTNLVIFYAFKGAREDGVVGVDVGAGNVLGKTACSG